MRPHLITQSREWLGSPTQRRGKAFGETTQKRRPKYLYIARHPDGREERAESLAELGAVLKVSPRGLWKNIEMGYLCNGFKVERKARD